MLPRIKIIFLNGALGQVPVADTGVLGYLCTGAAVASTFQLGKSYILRSPDSLTPLGITEANNPCIFKAINDHYKEASYGTETWLMGFPDTVKMSDMVDVTDLAKGRALINAANGKLRGLIVTRKPGVGYTPTIATGFDADVFAALTKAQALATWATDQKYAPLFVLLEGYAYNGDPATAKDLTQGSERWCSVFVGSTESTGDGASVGLLGGRVAENDIHINVGRVRDGRVATDTAYLHGTKVEEAEVGTLHDKGYITFRTHVGRSGYFFTDDPTATLSTDDYNHLTAVRTIQEAYRIAYNTLLDELNDYVEVNNDGTMQAPRAKSIQTTVENAVALGLAGKLNRDKSNPNDRGVVALIDLTQNIVSTGKWSITVKVKPFGYSRYIDVPLGFQAVSV